MLNEKCRTKGLFLLQTIYDLNRSLQLPSERQDLATSIFILVIALSLPSFPDSSLKIKSLNTTSVKELTAVALHQDMVAVYFKAVVYSAEKEHQTSHRHSQKSVKVEFKF